MPDLQNKNTSAFITAINKYAEKQKKLIQDEVEAFKKEELKKAEAEVLKDSYNLVQKELADTRRKFTKELSQKNIQAKRELLIKREELMADVFNKAKQELLKFTTTNKYLALIKQQAKNIANVLQDSETVLLVKSSDLKYQNELTASFGAGCKVVVDNSIEIGGLKGKSRKKGLIADETLDSKLENQREWFEANSGLTVV